MTEATRSNPKQCAGTRKDGSRCTARVMGAGSYCFAHDPEKAAQRQAARASGGRNRATRARLDRLVPATLRPMIGSLLEALDEVHVGDLDPKQASAMAALAGAITRAYAVGVLEDRVAALEGTAGGSTTA